MAPKGVTGAVPGGLPTVPAAPRPLELPILSSSSLPNQGPSGWRTRTLTTGEAGPWQLRVFGPTAVGVVCGSWGQRSRTASVPRNRAVRIDLRLGLEQVTTVLVTQCPTEGLVAKLPSAQPEQLGPHSGSHQNPASPAPMRWRRKREFAIVLLVPPLCHQDPLSLGYSTSCSAFKSHSEKQRDQTLEII